VGPIQVHNHQRENDKLVFLRNPASSKGMAEVAFIDAMSRPNSIDVNINVGGELGSMTLEPRHLHVHDLRNWHHQVSLFDLGFL
jgi:hypothetical protein